MDETPVRPHRNAKGRNGMTSLYVLAVSITLALAGGTIAQPSGEAKTKAPKAAAGQPIFTAAADLKWADLDPKGAPGVKVADLWGDRTKGAFGAYLKLPAGFAVPLHTHTHAMKVIFVSGTYVQAPEGKPEVRLGPGSYMMQPGGNYRHTTSCDKASDCVFFVESSGAFDLKVVETPKSAAKD
jgi:anti-sigma factor ChrR (cupin superfamily)